MSGDTFHLWGFDGELKGNEERLQARLPMFSREGSSEVFLAKKLDWSPALPNGDVVRLTAERAEEVGERLDIRGPVVVVTPGRYVVVAGPKMRGHLFQLNLLWFGHAVQDRFSVKLMDSASFDSYSAGIQKLAMRKFDIAIASGKATDAARTALAVMRNIGSENVRPELIRTLALHFLAGETDLYIRVLRLGAKRLQEDPEQLKKEMLEHLEFVNESPPFRFFVGQVQNQRRPVGAKRATASPGAGVTIFHHLKSNPEQVKPLVGRAVQHRHADPRRGYLIRPVSKGPLVRLSNYKTTGTGSSRIDPQKLTHWIVGEK